MLKTFHYRLYPSNIQKDQFARTFGSCRFIYNKTLEYKNTIYHYLGKSLSYNYLSSKYLKSLKQEYEFLNEPYSQALQASIKNLDRAFQNFFKHNSKFPKFKSKFSKQSFQLSQNVKVNFKDSTITLPKIGKVIAVLHRKFDIDNSKIKTCTISKNKCNQYFISVLVDINEEVPIAHANGKAIGIDLGIKHFLITSDNEKIDNPKFYHKQLKKIKALQKVISRKTKGSHNFAKAKLKLSKLYQKVCNKRDDFQHKLSSKIVNENQVIILEDLSVKSLLEQSYRNISRNIWDVAWSSFVSQIIYKADSRGKIWYQIDRFEPSSKNCFVCEIANEDLSLSDRYWECPHCGTFHDRDINAAHNILEIGLKDLQFKFGLEHPELKRLGQLRISILENSYKEEEAPIL